VLSYKSASHLVWTFTVILTASGALAQSESTPNDNDLPRGNEPQGAHVVQRIQLQGTPEAVSDLLIVLDSDGRSYTAQHSIASNGPTVRLRFPESLITQEVLIYGPQQDSQREQHKRNPKLLTLQNGTAFVRYQHQYGEEIQQTNADHFVLTTTSAPENIDTIKLSRNTTTWVFSNEFELISYTVTDKTTGHWVAINNTLTFHQLSDEPVALSINYKKRNSTTIATAPACPTGVEPGVDCTKDKDEDGVPDYRDVCLGELGQTNNEFGCPSVSNMVLVAVNFSTGRTYLDVAARAALNRVASALLRNNDKYVEIGAHTDNAGAASSNLALSKKRADAVRHYLILKGVNPNTIRATGYGERYPIRDNASKDGRRANRRVELLVLQ